MVSERKSGVSCTILVKGLLVMVLGLIVVTGCDGGGGGDDGLDASVKLTTSNAKSVAGTLVDMADVADPAELDENVDGLAEDLGVFAEIATRARGASSGKGLSSAALERPRSAKALRVALASSLRVSITAIEEESYECDSGRLTVLFNDADDNGEFSTGDTLELTSDDCFIAESDSTIVGKLSVTGVVLSGDFEAEVPPWRLAATFTYDNVRLSSPEFVGSIDGDLRFDISTDDGILINTAVSANSLREREGSATVRLSNFSIEEVFDEGSLAYRVEYHGRLSTTALGGAVDYETLTVFEGTDDQFPSSGVLLIEGENSSVRLTALDSVNVRLEIDSDGDGSFGETIDTAWEDLEESS